MSERKISKMSDELKAMAALERSLNKILDAGEMKDTLLIFAKNKLVQIEKQVLTQMAASE